MAVEFGEILGSYSFQSGFPAETLSLQTWVSLHQSFATAMGSLGKGETFTHTEGCAEPGIALGVRDEFYLIFLTMPWKGVIEGY